MTHALSHHHDDRSRLLARLIRELLATPAADDFEDLADVVEALKWRCARLRIAWTNDSINDALRLVASNVPLPNSRVLEARRRRMAVQQRRLEEPPISRAEAAAILKHLGVRL